MLVGAAQGQAHDHPAKCCPRIVSSGGAVVDIIAITAIAGILIGAMNLTGVAFSLTQQLLGVSGGSLPLLLIITAIRGLRPRACRCRPSAST